MKILKILVFSDSHDQCEKMADIIKQFKSKSGTLDYIIHLGDLVHDAKYLQEKFPDIPVLYVYGNCDITFDARDYEKEYELGGKKFFILHGHTKGVKYSSETLKSLGKQKGYDIILYGHLHSPREDYHEGTYIISPGSVYGNRDRRGKSYCVVDITNDDLCANIIRFDE